MSILLFHNGLAAASVLALIGGLMLLRLAWLISGDQLRVGRHWKGAVGFVPPDWMPPIGARRISALLGDTQRIDPERVFGLTSPRPNSPEGGAS